MHHPPLPTLGAIRNWILREFDDEVLVMMDDDIQFIQCRTGINMNSDEPMAVIEVARLVCDVLEVPFRVTYEQRPVHDPTLRVPDLTCARTMGWSAQTPLETGIRRLASAMFDEYGL